MRRITVHCCGVAPLQPGQAPFGVTQIRESEHALLRSARPAKIGSVTAGHGEVAIELPFYVTCL